MSLSLLHGGYVVDISDETRAENRQRAMDMAATLHPLMQQFHANVAREMEDYVLKSHSPPDQTVMEYFRGKEARSWDRDSLAALIHYYLDIEHRDWRLPLDAIPEDEDKVRAIRIADHAMELGRNGLIHIHSELYDDVFASDSQEAISNTLTDCYNARSLTSQIIIDPNITFEEAAHKEAKKRRFLLEPWTEFQSHHGRAWDAEQAFIDNALLRRVLFHNHVIFMPDYFPASDDRLYYEQLFTVGSNFRSSGPDSMRFGFVGIDRIGQDGKAEKHMASVYLLSPRVLKALRSHPLGQEILDEMGELGTEANHDDIHTTVFAVENVAEDDIPHVTNFYVKDSPLYEQGPHPAMHEWTARLEYKGSQVSPLESYSVHTQRDRVNQAFHDRPHYLHKRVERCCRFMEKVKAFREMDGIDYEMSDYIANFYLRRNFNDIYMDHPALNPVRAVVDDLLPQERPIRLRDTYRMLFESDAFEHRYKAAEWLLGSLSDETFLAELNKKSRDGKTMLGHSIRNGLFSEKPIEPPLSAVQYSDYIQTARLLLRFEGRTGQMESRLGAISDFMDNGSRRGLSQQDRVHLQAIAGEVGIDLTDNTRCVAIASIMRDMNYKRHPQAPGCLQGLEIFADSITEEFLRTRSRDDIKALLQEGFAQEGYQSYFPEALRPTYDFLKRVLIQPDGVPDTLGGYDAQRMRVTLSGFYDMVHNQKTLPFREDMRLEAIRNPHHPSHDLPVPEVPASRITDSYSQALERSLGYINVSSTDRFFDAIRVKSERVVHKQYADQNIGRAALSFFLNPVTGEGFISDLRTRANNEDAQTVCDHMQKKVEGCYRAIRSRHPNVGRFGSTDNLMPVIDAFREVVQEHCPPASRDEALAKLDQFERNIFDAVQKPRTTRASAIR